MTHDELEFSISLYIDGGLPPVETIALEERLATDAEARNLLAEYKRLNGVIKAIPGVPELKWDLLAARITDSLAGEEPPIRNYSIKWVTWATRGALAAAMIIAAGVFFRGVSQSPISNKTHNALPAVAVIEGPKIEVAASGAKIAEIAIGPADETAELNSRYADTIVSRPSHIMIASGIDENDPSAHDGPMMPY